MPMDSFLYLLIFFFKKYSNQLELFKCVRGALLHNVNQVGLVLPGMLSSKWDSNKNQNDLSILSGLQKVNNNNCFAHKSHA